jgi:hypothetical protein
VLSLRDLNQEPSSFQRTDPTGALQHSSNPDGFRVNMEFVGEQVQRPGSTLAVDRHAERIADAKKRCSRTLLNEAAFL